MLVIRCSGPVGKQEPLVVEASLHRQLGLQPFGDLRGAEAPVSSGRRKIVVVGEVPGATYTVNPLVPAVSRAPGRCRLESGRIVDEIDVADRTRLAYEGQEGQLHRARD